MDVEGFATWLLAQPLHGSTPACYAQRMRSVARWVVAASIDLNTCPAVDLIPLVAATPNTYSSRVLLRATLKWWWRYTHRLDPPLDVVVIPPKPKYSCRAVDEDVAVALAEASWGSHPHGTAVLAGLFLGARISEIAAMEWTRFNEGWYHILGKGIRERDVPVADRLAIHLRSVPHEDARWLFPGSGKLPHVHRSTVWKWIQRICDDAEVGPVAPHRLRHTFGATLNDKTGDFRTTQELMGHSDPKTTAIYTRATRVRMKEAIAVLQFQP